VSSPRPIPIHAEWVLAQVHSAVRNGIHPDLKSVNSSNPWTITSLVRSFDSASRNWWRYGDYLASGELCILGFAHKGASAPRSRTEVLIPNLDHLIPLRGIGGGMGIRTPDLLIANETLYQLSYTPQLD
jgi:hypothetical protein